MTSTHESTGCGGQPKEPSPELVALFDKAQMLVLKQLSKDGIPDNLDVHILAEAEPEFRTTVAIVDEGRKFTGHGRKFIDAAAKAARAWKCNVSWD